MATKKSIKIAVTGGPSGGKTTLIETLQKEFGNKVAIVPEAASILYRGGFPRKRSFSAQRYVQRAIYYTQAELEGLIKGENPDRLIICDRGSLDGLAYWPDPNQDFFESLETTLNYECARYDWVLHLDTASADAYDSANPIRIESFEEAASLNDKIKKAWECHPNRFIIPHQSDFFSKMGLALNIIQLIIQGKSKSEILQSIPKM